MPMFEVGDPVERRAWIGMTKGQVVEVTRDDATVAVEWQVGFRLAGTRTTENAAATKIHGAQAAGWAGAC